MCSLITVVPCVYQFTGKACGSCSSSWMQEKLKPSYTWKLLLHDLLPQRQCVGDAVLVGISNLLCMDGNREGDRLDA